MKKLIKFKSGAKQYIRLAEQKYEDDDLEGTAYYFYKTYQETKDLDSLINLGETYCEMGECEEALKYLFLALDRVPGDEELCHSIAHCFMDLNDEETAFFYFQPRMTIKRFKYIMRETERVESEYSPQIRVVERNDDVVVNIAVKLLSSGDVEYARELLLTVKPDSKLYIAACNLLALSFLEEDNADEALRYSEMSMKAKPNIDARCNMMTCYFIKEDKENIQRLKAEIGRQKLDLAGHKTASLSFIRMGDAASAVVHLKVLFDAAKYNRDALVSYALAVYNLGEKDKAKDLIVSASRLYPADISVKEIALAMARDDKMDLFPFMKSTMAADWINEVEDKLKQVNETGNDFFDDEDFKYKVTWIFQTGFSVRQSRAAAILCKFSRWRSFFKDRLLDGNMDLATKKICLFTMLLSGKSDTIGLVIDGMYSKVKVKYPEGMNKTFLSAYCHAFASFAFSDSNFEERLFSGTKKLLKKFNLQGFDQSVIKSEDALAALIFYTGRHSRINEKTNCCHLFGCDEKVMTEYMALFDVKERNTKSKTKKRG